eukprot:3962754-Pyramimonas_sp.AAC.1
MSAFAKFYPGGATPVLLSQIRACAKMLGDNRKGLGPQTSASLSSVSFAQGPEWMAACATAALAAPDFHCRDGQANLLSSTDLQSVDNDEGQALGPAMHCRPQICKELASLYDASHGGGGTQQREHHD